MTVPIPAPAPPTRPRPRRIVSFILALLTFLGLGAILAPSASANAIYEVHTNCFFSTLDRTPVKVWWERSSGGGSRHGYKAAFGTAAGSPNDELIGALNFWQSDTKFGPAVNNSYVVYPNAYSYATPAQPSSRMPYFANSRELHLNLELTRKSDGAKCRIEWRIYTTGATVNG